MHFTKVQACPQAELARAFFWRMKANGHIVIIITSYQVPTPKTLWLGRVRHYTCMPQYSYTSHRDWS